MDLNSTYNLYTLPLNPFSKQAHRTYIPHINLIHFYFTFIFRFSSFIILIHPKNNLNNIQMSFFIYS